VTLSDARGRVRDDLDQMGILTIGLPDRAHADELVLALEDSWACCVLEQPASPTAAVFLSPHNASDFSHLMRRVQTWLAERSLGAISFELRGRGHIHGHTPAPSL
jgi:hypothetical protein